MDYSLALGSSLSGLPLRWENASNGHLALLGREGFAGDQTVGNGEQGQGVFARGGGVQVQGVGFHFHRQNAHFPQHSGGRNGLCVVEGIRGEHRAGHHAHPQLFRGGRGGGEQRIGAAGRQRAVEAELFAIGGIGIAAHGGHQIPQMQIGAHGPGGAYADDIFHAIEIEKLI